MGSNSPTGGGSAAGRGDKTVERATGARHNFQMLRPTLQIVDEIGLPVINTEVRITRESGKTISCTTDGEGKVQVPTGRTETFVVEIADIHEAGPGDSCRTPSGHHFALGACKPATNGA